MKLGNEKGYTLVTVLLVGLILTTLGLVLLAASINGTKHTQIRETEIKDDIGHVSAVKEGVTLIQNYINENGKRLMQTYSLQEEARENLDNIHKYIGELEVFYQSANSSGKFAIMDITSNNDTPTRILEVSSGTGPAKYSQKVYLTAMPGFLKYALGAGERLTINGSPYINGNIYARDQLEISNQALYQMHLNKSKVLSDLSKATELPAVKDYSELHANRNQIELCSTAPACYTGKEKNESKWQPLSVSRLQDAFSDGNILFYDVNQSFNHIDIKETFIDKLSGYTPLNSGMSVEEINQIINEKVKAIDPIRFNSLPNDRYIVHPGSAYIDSTNIALQDEQWLVITGDATIDNSMPSMDVKGNMLITGDLTIKGNVGFDSVIYVLGSTRLDNAEIPCYQNRCGNEPSDPSLILMTEGQLSIARVNKFKEDTNTLNGYFYAEGNTATEASEVYAVGSRLHVNGGIFSNHSLAVNSYRGDVDGLDEKGDLIFSPTTIDATSRLTVKNSRRLFLNKTEALPKVEGLDVITDKLKKGD